MDHFLGVSVTNRTVFAALVEDRPDGPVVLRTLSRPRVTSDLDFAIEETEHEFAPAADTSNDPTVVFTTSESDASDLFLGSEFGLKTLPGAAGEEAVPEAGAASIRTQTVEIELKELLAECAEAGYPEVRVVLCSASSDIAVHELALGEAERKADASGSSTKDRLALLSTRRRSGDHDRRVRALGKELDQRLDPERVFFLPMTPNDTGKGRFLGVWARAGEPLVPTLERFVDRGREMPRFALIETEISLLLGLGRLTIPVDEVNPLRRLVLRVGAEDTLVMFLEGQNIRHYESLRSITRYDPPETIGSRILLLQDEYGLGEADSILVLGDGNELELVEVLAEFFPDSAVASLRGVLPPYVDEFEADESRESALATAAALRGLSDPHGRAAFEPVNLLPRQLVKRRRVEVPIAWQNYAMLAVLFASSMFFVARYLKQQNEIEVSRARLERQYKPDAVRRSKTQLEFRRDSLYSVVQQYSDALQVLDTLLYGSDRWSRAMEMTASNAAAVSGVWIENWSEEGDQIVMSGTATDRNQIVRLAARMEGVISQMTFSSIRDWPVFSYRMTVPLRRDLPEAVHYLREQVRLGVQVPVIDDGPTAEQAISDSNESSRPAEVAAVPNESTPATS